MMKAIWITALCLLTAQVNAQNVFRDSSIFSAPVTMDAVTVKASTDGFDVAAFIHRVQTDTTFYKAFRAMRTVGYRAGNDIKILDKEGGIKASLYSHTTQRIAKGCRTMKVEDEKTTGNFYTRKGGYNWFTAELYAYLFFTKEKVCGETDIIAGKMEPRESGTLGKSKWQLEQLIFRPGSKVKGVPFIGDKASIFEPDVARMYDFTLLSSNYEGESCWLFRAVPKKEFVSQAVYNDLSTWFRKSDFAILARNYALSYHTLLFDFDVKMKVRLQPRGARLFPVRIDYDGNWHVQMKDRERARFTATFQY